MEESRKSSQHSALSNVFFVLGYLLRVNKKLYLCRVPLTLLNILSPLANAYLFAVLINELTTEPNLPRLLPLVLLLAGANLAISLLRLALVRWDRCEKERTLCNIKLDLGKTVAQMPFAQIETPRIKDFLSLAGDTSLFSRTMDATVAFVGSVIAVLTYSSVLIHVQPWLLLVIGVSLAVQFLFGRMKLKYNDKWRTAQEPIFRKLWYYEGLLCDPRYGKELRVNRLQPWMIQKANFVYEGECAPIVRTNVKSVALLDFIAQIFKIAELIFIYAFLSVKVLFGGMLIGDFTFYLSSATNFSGALSGLTDNVLELKECGTFIREFRFFHSCRPKERPLPDSDGPIRADGYSIEFRHVSFKYPNTDRYVLKDVSFKVAQGDKLSLVGVNGSGKTTLVKLLCRFYEPTEGVITVGGVDIRRYGREEYSRLLGVVFQDFRLFSFSVQENVTMGEKEDPDRIDGCLEKCGLSEKAKGLAYGLQTSVYKDFDGQGTEFSGGEGQKLAIARALYKDSPIMILDEPTASLDPIAEYEVLDKILSASKDKTSIIISHRLSTTRQTDCIAVLQDGVLVEFGSHLELMKRENGVYREMFSIQKGNYA